MNIDWLQLKLSEAAYGITVLDFKNLIFPHVYFGSFYIKQ